MRSGIGMEFCDGASRIGTFDKKHAIDDMHNVGTYKVTNCKYICGVNMTYVLNEHHYRRVTVCWQPLMQQH